MSKPANTISADQMREIGRRIFTACGAPPEEAEALIREMVRSSLMGIDSHGISSIGQYVSEVKSGMVVPGTPLRVITEHGALAVVDCGFNFGIVNAVRAADMAVRKAGQSGVSCVIGERSHHVGRLGTFVQRISEAGQVGIAFASSSTKYRRWGGVAPWGGREGRLSTNPIAYAVPHGDWPILFDMTTASVPKQKLKVIQRTGGQAPSGSLIDAEGRDTTDPSRVLAGEGAILPFGGSQGHKGYGLALLAEIVSGFLSGDRFSPEEKEGRYCNAFCFLALNPEASCGLEVFGTLMADYRRYIESCPARDPARPVIMPGEIERRTYQERSRDGIPITREEWKHIVESARSVGVEL